jgi:hypothetical protein
MVNQMDYTGYRRRIADMRTNFLDEGGKVLDSHYKGLFTPEETISKLTTIMFLLAMNLDDAHLPESIETKISNGIISEGEGAADWSAMQRMDAAVEQAQENAYQDNEARRIGLI